MFLPGRPIQTWWSIMLKMEQATQPKSALDTQSHELFPELGAPKGKSANIAPVWGAKSGAKFQVCQPHCTAHESDPARWSVGL